MHQIFSARKLATVLVGSLLAFNVYGNTFYCADGKEMKCLGFGEKIVGNNDICFKPLTCSQEGFVCKSELNELEFKHETLFNKHSELVNTHNELLESFENTLSDYKRVEGCVAAAYTLEEAKSCL